MYSGSEILISGRSCRLPGADDYDQFVDLLLSGVCSVSTIPDDRWMQWRFLHPKQGVPGKAYTLAAGVISDVWGFDPKPFNISPREAEQMDPQQRILLQVVWEALESANIKPSEIRGSNVGVYVGASSMDFGTRLMFDETLPDVYSMTGGTLSVVSNRISYVFDLHGPSLTVDTACSSSIVALNEAYSALKTGRIDTAIVAGVNLLLNPLAFLGFSAGKFLSPTGLCKSFSNDADGYVRSEGVVALVLRRADSEIGKNAPVYGRVLGVDVNSDGKTSGIALPQSATQANLLKSLYKNSKVDPNQLSFVEAHGTGTQVGDVAEANSISDALSKYRSDPLPIGSVKSNIGHLEAASGMAGILKALVAFDQKILPASLHLETPNKNINFEEANIALTSSSIDLPKTTNGVIAGVSSFGFGGTNAHVILGSALEDELAPVSSPLVESATDVNFAMISAYHSSSLISYAQSYSKDLSSNPQVASYICSELADNRDTYPVRLGVLQTSESSLESGLKSYLNNEHSFATFEANSNFVNEPVVFVYSGNGAQYNGMSLAAYQSDKQFRTHYQNVSDHFEKIADWSLVDMLSDPQLAEKIRQASIAQPLLFADQVALSLALIDRGLRPQAVLGHSGGEIAAAHICGSLDLEQALRTIFERSKSQELLYGKGTMAAMQAPASEVQAELDKFPNFKTTIAAVNSPKSITLVGPEDEIDEFKAYAKKKKRWAGVKLPIDYPYHSPLQDEIETVFREGLKYITPTKGHVAFYSCVEGKAIPGENLDVDYWWKLLRQPVKFMDAIKAAHADGFNLFLECGPQPVLTSYMSDTFAQINADVQVTYSLEKKDQAVVNPVTRSLCRAYVNGAKLDSELFHKQAVNNRYQLPSYPWQNTEFRMDQTDMIQNYMGNNADNYLALGRKLDADANTWMSQIDSVLRSDLAQHIVHKRAIVPGTFFMEVAIAACRRVLDSNAIEIRDIDIFMPLVLSDKNVSDMRTQAMDESSSITISSRATATQNPWMMHMKCRYGHAPAFDNVGNDPAPNVKLLKNDITSDHVYEIADRMRLHYGPLFRRVSHVRKIDDYQIEVILTSEHLERIDGSSFDPITLDCLMHGLLVGLDDAQRSLQDGLVYVPIHVGRVRAYENAGCFKSGRIKILSVGKKSVVADLDCFDEDGNLTAQLIGLRLSAMRIFNAFDLEASTYKYASLPVIENKEKGVLAKQVTSARFMDIFLGKASSNRRIAEDESYLLIEAICLRIAYDAVASVADEEGLLTDKFMLDGNQEFITLLLDMLEATELVENTDRGWLLDKDVDLPNVDLQISALLQEMPNSISEAAILSRLSSLSSYLLHNDDISSISDLFGSELLASYKSASISSSLATELVQEAISEFISAMPDGMLGNLALITENKALWQSKQISQAKNYNIDILDYLDIESADRRYQFIIFPSGLNIGLLTNVDTNSIASILDENCAIAFVERTSGSLNNMLRIIEHVSKASNPLFYNKLYDENTLPQIFGVKKSNNFKSSDLTIGLHGFRLFVSDFTNENDEAELKYVNDNSRNKISGKVDFVSYISQHSNFVALVDNNAANINVLERYATDASYLSATIVYLPAICTDQEQLEKRIIYLSDLFKGYDEKPRAIWFVLPKGYLCNEDDCVDPFQVSIWAYARTVQNEFPYLQVKCIDLAEDKIADIERLLSLVDMNGSETEMLIQDDKLNVLRVVNGLQAHNSGNTTHDLENSDLKAVLTMPDNGRLDELHWAITTKKAPDENEVEIEVGVTGLNYRDVMWALGLLPEEALENGFAGASLGIEFSGRVTKIGKNVSSVQPGDLVVSIGANSFASHVTVDEHNVYKLPNYVDPMAAATIPVAFFTSYYSLIHLARLERNEIVLIHGAAGGVGLAAIQVAKAVGAKVIGTAGTDSKRDLLRILGVDEVLDSRSLKFADDVKRITDGKGVDVILNSLAGEAMELSLDCLRSFGRFLEIGKQDFYQNTNIGMRALKDNINYFGIDADQVMAAKPKLVSQIFKDIMQNFEDGIYFALPYRVFEGHQTVEAFRIMQRSAHIGKVVVKPIELSSNLPLLEKDVFEANAEGVHVIVGGLGGLGLSVMSWLASKGAMTIMLLARNTNLSDEARGKINLLKENGIDVRICQCDVSDRDAVFNVFSSLREQMPIRGIIHTAMVIEDTEIRDLNTDVLRKTLDAKVKGTQNLDIVSRDDNLDYFVMFSSVASMIGNIGQAAYVASNAFMEGLAKKRVNEGLPALAIGWGAVVDAGYLTRETGKADVIKKLSGNIEFYVSDLLNALEEVLLSQSKDNFDPVLTVTPMSWSSMSELFSLISSPTYSVLSKLGKNDDKTMAGGNLRASLEGLPIEEMQSKLVEFIANEIASILRVPVSELSLSRNISDFGMDSLMGVEFAMGTQQSLGDDIPMALISVESMSIVDVADKIAGHITNRQYDSGESNSVINNLAAQHAKSTVAGDNDFHESLLEHKSNLGNILS